MVCTETAYSENNRVQLSFGNEASFNTSMQMASFYPVTVFHFCSFTIQNTDLSLGHHRANITRAIAEGN